MTQRDWQKDMDMCEAARETENGLTAFRELGVGGPMMATYWLQEAKIYKQSYEGTLTAYEAEKARADAAEAREQQLKEAVQLAVNDLELWSDKILAAKVVLGQLQRTLSTLYPDTPAPTPEIKQQFSARPLDEWHEEMGDMLWWMFPIQEPPYCGNPLDSDWSDCYTHWTPFVIPADPAPKEGR
ncbi:hypothetical protein MHI32_01520 [Paenibacillus sp. FSL H7-0690]|uniref:hypothetical protein n=1 Tax=Paenibacillus sp. FSL H7-0690 TaxID=2921437 RepID=UPI0030EB5D2D